MEAIKAENDYLSLIAHSRWKRPIKAPSYS